MSNKTWYEVANDWIIYGCDPCGNDFNFSVKRSYASIDICCPRCGGQDVFETGEKIDGRVVGDDYYGE